jgi:hypothetical protein
MKLSDILTKPSSKALRQFAGAWLVFFLAVAAHQGFVRGHHQWGLAIAVVALVVGGLGLLRPAAIRWIFTGWMLLAFPIGWVISQLALLLLFYCIITPAALLLRLKRHDPLHLRPQDPASSLWTVKQTPADLRRYFRQY